MGLAESLTRRSSISAAAGYGFANYSLTSGGHGLINNDSTGAQAVYRYDLTPRSQIGILYQFQNLTFPGAGHGKVQASVGQLLYSRQVSSRTNLALAVGPEVATVSEAAAGTAHPIGVSGFGSLDHRLRRGGLGLSYSHEVSNGSGLFAGATTDAVQFSSDRPSRRWLFRFDAGYVRFGQLNHSPGPIPDQSYQYGFAGVAAQRQLGRFMGVFVGYQFSDQSTGNCSVSSFCNWAGQVHALSIGLNLSAPARRLR